MNDIDHSATLAPAADDQASALRRLVQDQAPVALAAPAPPTPARQRRPGRVIVIASGKGGVGKTCLAVNLCVSMAASRARVVLIDADLGTANADLLCGMSPVARLNHVVTPLPVQDGARRSIRDIARPAPGGFHLVPGASGVSRLANLTPDARARLLDAVEAIEQDADIVVIDTGAGIGSGVVSLVNAADIALIVATPEPTSMTDAYALIKCVSHDGADPVGPGRRETRLRLVVNQAADAPEALGVHARMRAVADRFLAIDLPLAGWVAQDLRVPQSVRRRKPLLVHDPRCATARQIGDLASRITQDLGCPDHPAAPANHSGLAVRMRRLFR